MYAVRCTTRRVARSVRSARSSNGEAAQRNAQRAARCRALPYDMSAATSGGDSATLPAAAPTGNGPEHIAISCQLSSFCNSANARTKDLIFSSCELRHGLEWPDLLAGVDASCQEVRLRVGAACCCLLLVISYLVLHLPAWACWLLGLVPAGPMAHPAKYQIGVYAVYALRIT
jgi:hypothetical protein